VLAQPSDHPRAAVLDFSARSSTPRFHVIASGQVLQSFRVSHGHGSEGKRDDGYAEVFSNERGASFCRKLIATPLFRISMEAR
jgi:hypothetical protein